MLKQKQILPFINDTIKRRFWKKIRLAEPDACWIWTGATRRRVNGANEREWEYGVMKIGAKHYFAHRLSYVIATGCEIPEGMVIDHVQTRCTHKDCVNPAHLEMVTPTENVARHHNFVNPNCLCKLGHERKRGKQCQTCNRLKLAAWKKANPERYRAIWKKYEAKRSKARWQWHKEARAAAIRDPEVVS